MATQRLSSLDVFRGLTVAGMVVVNNPGTWRFVYPPLRHADWHGWTPTDLVFPFFLFIVGVAIPLALGPRRDAGEPRGRLVRRILRRGGIILGLGLLLHALPFFDLANLRIPGVLQRIALCYVAAALLFLVTGWRGQAAVAGVLLLGYWAAMALVPVPGHGAGDLGKEGNLAAWLDRAVLGQAHMWRVSRVYDPEGLLSTIPAIATTLAGVLTGHWLRAGRAGVATVRAVVAAGAVAVALGLVWGRWFPINKALWTSSYVLFSAGAALLVLAACYWLVEVRDWRRWGRPLEALGVNALAIFFLSGVLAKLLVLIRTTGADGRPRPLQTALFETVFAPALSPENASLAFAAATLLLWVAVAWTLYRQDVRISV